VVKIITSGDNNLNFEVEDSYTL